MPSPIDVAPCGSRLLPLIRSLVALRLTSDSPPVPSCSDLLQLLCVLVVADEADAVAFEHHVDEDGGGLLQRHVLALAIAAIFGHAARAIEHERGGGGLARHRVADRS